MGLGKGKPLGFLCERLGGLLTVREEAGEGAEGQCEVVNMLRSLRVVLVAMPRSLRDEACVSSAL